MPSETRSSFKDLFAFRYPIILRFSGLWFNNPCLSFKIARDVQMRIMSGMSHKGLKLYMYYDEEIHFAFSLLVTVLINTISNVTYVNYVSFTTRNDERKKPDIPNCLSFFKDPLHWEITSYLEVYSSSRLTLYRSVALLAGMYREHLPGLRIGILSVHRGTRRSPDQKLRTLL